MTEEIRQNGCTVLASCSEHAIPMIFNNLCGKNFSGKEYRDCGNGYYYLLINDKFMIGYDID